MQVLPKVIQMLSELVSNLVLLVQKNLRKSTRLFKIK